MSWFPPYDPEEWIGLKPHEVNPYPFQAKGIDWLQIITIIVLVIIAIGTFRSENE